MTPKPQDARPVQLHVIHDLGGGSAKWVEDFASADHERKRGLRASRAPRFGAKAVTV